MRLIKSTWVALYCNLEKDMYTKTGQINQIAGKRLLYCGMAGYPQIGRERQELMLMEEAEDMAETCHIL